MERVKTCIEGLDELVEGGFPRGSNIIITGTPGTGKSTFVLQFIVKGAQLYGDRGIFISLEDPLEKIKEEASLFNWDLDKLEKKGRLLMFHPQIKPERGEDPLEWIKSSEIKEKIEEFEAERVGIDSLTLLFLLSNERREHRRGIQIVLDKFGLGKATTLFTHERKIGKMDNIEYTMEEFVADGIIYLQRVRVKNSFKRLMSVLKMRVTNHSQDIHPFAIQTGKGLSIYPSEMIFQ